MISCVQLVKLQRIQNIAIEVCLKVNSRTPTDWVHNKSNVNYLFDRQLSHANVEGYKRSRNTEYIRDLNVNLHSIVLIPEI